MPYQIKLEQFQGPLDVLLELIEQKKLDITTISLSEITESFLHYLEAVEQLYPEELADFLVIATRLLYIKSRLLLPFATPDEEESEIDLAEHLRMYKEFRNAAFVLADRINEQKFACPRPVPIARLLTVEFSPPPNVTVAVLRNAFGRALDHLETIVTIPQAAMRKAITLRDKIRTVIKLLHGQSRVAFSSLVGENGDRLNFVLTFLAILELVKRNHVTAKQEKHGSDIIIVCHETSNVS